MASKKRTGTRLECNCEVRKMYERRKDKKRKRQTFVYNPEEEVWHEIYMQDLRKEFSDVSILCTSKIELPWKDIALPSTAMKIRPDVVLSDSADREDKQEEGAEAELENKESTGGMVLPWHDLIAMDTVTGEGGMIGTCDSSLEIPWDDLALEKPMQFSEQREEESCPPDAIEIPWDIILMPRNIVIESDKMKTHPSSKYPPRSAGEGVCLTCGAFPCCAKMKGLKS